MVVVGVKVNGQTAGVRVLWTTIDARVRPPRPSDFD